MRCEYEERRWPFRTKVLSKLHGHVAMCLTFTPFETDSILCFDIYNPKNIEKKSRKKTWKSFHM